MFARIKDIVSKEKLFFFILLPVVFLRFFKLAEFAMFLGDQGRDAIIIKRIITLEHFPAIGPPSSLGQIYLGPFYYYLIAPFLFLSRFNPVGPALGVALISIIGIIISYFVVKHETNFKTALVFFIFSAFSAVNIQFSRFSWNPNLLPIFSFFTLYFFYKLLTDKNKFYALASGAFLSFSIQLHHLAFLLFLPIVLSYLSFRAKSRNLLYTDVKKISPRASLGRNDIEKIFISLISFLFFSLPLLIFDLRHQFLNSKNLIKFFLEGNPTDHEQFISRFLATIQPFFSYVFQLNLNNLFAFFLFLIILYSLLNKFFFNKNLFILIHCLNFILFITIFSVFNVSRNAHYFGPIYLSFFFILSLLLINLTNKKNYQFLLVPAVLALYIFFNLKTLTYLFKPDGNQIKQAEIIAQSVLKQNPVSPYQTIALPQVETDGHIRYFLEIKGVRPLPADTLIEPGELYVFCFVAECKVLGNPQWQIASFQNAKIIDTWTSKNVSIYKLVHAK